MTLKAKSPQIEPAAIRFNQHAADHRQRSVNASRVIGYNKLQNPLDDEISALIREMFETPTGF